MSGPVSRTSRFWIVGLILILAPLGFAGFRLVALKESLTLIEAVFHGLVMLAGLTLLDYDIARAVFARLTRLREGRRN